MLCGLGGGRVGGDLRRGESRLMFQVINDELDDNRRRYGRRDWLAIAQKMPGAPVLECGLISTRRVAGSTFVKESRDGFLGFLGESVGILEGPEPDRLQ